MDARQRDAARVTGLAALVVLAWVYLLLWHGRFWQAGPVLGVAVPMEAPRVAVVVPARDEAEHVGAALRSLLAQDYAGEFSVILVDDGSVDGTGDIARGLADARLTVIDGAARPVGWSGKLWAVAQGVAAADDGVTLFLLTDADIVHQPGHLSALVARAERGGIDLVSEMVALRCESWAERALVPGFVYFFQMLYPFAWVNNTLRATAAAAGGTMLVRRRALQRIGGIAAVRGALIDDVALACAVKAGGRIWLGHSDLARSAREYAGFADIWRMIARTAFTQLRQSWMLLVLTVLGMGLVFIAPVLFAIFGEGWAQACGLLAWLVMSLSCWPGLRRFGLSPAWGVGLPLVAGFFTAATIGSALGRGVEWKRRVYNGSAL